MSVLPRPFAFEGDPALAPVVEKALRRVIDPEMALNIVDLGLVYNVGLRQDRADVRITMTSAACPVMELIVEDVRHELGEALPDGTRVEVEVCWSPPWTPEHMSANARAVMGWD
jgi:metal-sulfur cluster biosynthetic enzyme